MNFRHLTGQPGFRDEMSLPPEEWVHINFEDGGFGDHVARMTAVAYLVKKYPQLTVTVWCPKFFVDFARKAIPSVSWQEYSSAMSKAKMSRSMILAGSNGGITSLRKHLVDHAFDVIVDEQVPIEEKNYIKVDHTDVDLKKFNLPEKYIVLTTGYTTKVRELIPSVVNEIAEYVKQNNYNVVFLGSKNATVGGKSENIAGFFSEGINYSLGLDLRDKTTVSEAHAIIANSKCIVGLDNGLLHLAGCTDRPIVMGFTTVKPEHRVPYRNNQLGWNVHTVVPNESLGCRFCQSNMNFIYDFDFRNCYYVEKKVDNKIRCTTEASAAPYIEYLEKIIK